MTAIIILAAGSSSRLGSPKQNLIYQEQTLLQKAVASALSVTDTVLVVLGANREDIEYSVKDQPVNLLYNTKWTEGMATSISLAVEELQTNYPTVDKVIMMVCDQPFADTSILQKLVDVATRSEKHIIACSYNNTLGVPALFKANYFAYLLALKGDEGAKKLISFHDDDVQAVEFPLGNVDIDTVEDYEQLKSK